MCGACLIACRQIEFKFIFKPVICFVVLSITNIFSMNALLSYMGAVDSEKGAAQNYLLLLRAKFLYN